jgi:DegV family protein with EDD domain
MRKVAVVTDSTANLPPGMAEELDIPIIPLKVHWNDETYLDGITLDAMTFYRWLQEREELPVTSQPSAGEFLDFFKNVAEQFNTDTILGVFISSDMSGTVASAELAKQELPALQIEIVDSRSVSMGLGFSAIVAARMAKEDASLSEIAERLYQLREEMQIIFTVDTLEYLHRGGRIGGAARLLGTVLNLKPLLAVEDGQVEAVQKVRSRRKSLQQIIDEAQQRLNGHRPAELAVVQAEAEKDAERLTDWVNEQLRPRRLYHSILSPVVGTHGGPGTVGIAFYPEH